MPGRQAHGRPVGGAPRTNGSSGGSKGKGKKRSKANALNAFAIASEMYTDKPKMTPRNRELDAPRDGPPRRGGKHAREDDDDEDDEDDFEDEESDRRPPRKMRRGADDDGGEDDDDVEYGTDGSGNEWHVGGDDSDIDSDEAFGESDEEKFEGYTFRGSKKSKGGDEDDDDDEDGADGASLGSDAIDLADALDMSMSEDDAEHGAQQDEGTDEDDESDASDSGSGDESSEIEDDEGDDVSDSGINAWVSQFAGVKGTDEEDETSTTTKPKVGLKDLGLLTVKDPQLKKSVKLISKEEKESTRKQKLDVPLARRQQAQLDRSVAYEKTTETLDRWTETVKRNRRAEHLVFPLPQTETGLARHDNAEIQPVTAKAPGNELEQTIMAIMEESGLGPSAKKESKKAQGDEEGQTISRSELKNLWNQKRREREAKSREEARAKRIKKIKSKAYHRVHRRQRERDEMKEREIMAATGELDSEEEREAQGRQRAMERMGARHRESKWAKMRKGHAAWDDDVRTGIADMARRDEELRRRIEGRPSKSNDDDDEDEPDYSDDDEVDDRKRLLKQLDEVSKDDDSQPTSKLMSMAFMQKAEAIKRAANDEMIAQIRRELASDEEGGSEEEPDDIGRRQYGQPSGKKSAAVKEQSKGVKKGKAAKADTDLQDARDNIAASTNGRPKGLSAPASQHQTKEQTAGAWSQPAETGTAKKQRGKKSGSSADVLDLGVDSVAVAPVAAPPPAAAPRSAKKKQNGRLARSEVEDDDEEEDDDHGLVQFREQELLDRAFGGLDVVAEFEREKREVEKEDDDKVVDNTLPGWGSWVGDGVSNREKRRHQGRFLAKQEGVRQKKDRRDAKLSNSEKYTASQLPHVYESRLQYERSLRLPLGPEFQTKETFQDVTKPRVLLKQGIVAPIAKPMY
ncbi:hypothetical protein DL766_003282 [Monosporascus sp. MC13-8B]|uniref:Uncharacterized protein n=1 Tax=Monosporascus cannonballus TaxID=155416 RepID=A0ABY0GRL1_9PEZI|nr:hypothetical protein DL762_010074 [Monosporascus cannonballus]RYO93319.1 hypothetical protein DL763_004418 [Monosporascus cannonballus]RYP33789.1 hypothetical protein DL766_003282 [Monosporascus sp. MC13-8B]